MAQQSIETEETRNSGSPGLSVWYVVSFGLLLLSLEVLFPLFSTGYTHDDDTRVIFAMTWNDIITGFLMLRRLQLLLPICWIPHLFDSFVYFKFLSLLPIAVSFYLFYSCLFGVSRSRSFSFLGTLVLVLSLQNSLQFNLLSANHFSLYVGICLILLSVILLTRYFNNNSFWSLIGSSISLFGSFLIYEANLLYVLVILSLVVYRQRQLRGGNLVSTLKTILPFVILSGLFVFSTIAARWIGAESAMSYGGTQVSMKLRDFLQTLWQYSVSALPGYIYFHYDGVFNEASDSLIGHQYGWVSLLYAMRSEWLLKFLLSFALCYLLLVRLDKKILWRHITASVFLGVALMFLPNILIAATVKYQMVVVQYGAITYTGTNYSVFGVAVVLASFAVAGAQALREKKALLRLYSVLVALTFAFFGYLDDYSNYHVSREQRSSRLVWDLMDDFIKSEEFQALPDDGVIFAPTLWATVVGNPDYWTKYVKYKSGKSIVIAKELSGEKALPEHLYFLKFLQVSRDGRQFVAFSPVREVSAIESSPTKRSVLFGDRLSLYVLSENKRFQVLLRLKKGESREVKVDGVSRGKYRRYAVVGVNKQAEAKKTVKTVIEAREMDLDATNITFFLNTSDR